MNIKANNDTVVSIYLFQCVGKLITVSIENVLIITTTWFVDGVMERLLNEYIGELILVTLTTDIHVKVSTVKPVLRGHLWDKENVAL